MTKEQTNEEKLIDSTIFNESMITALHNAQLKVLKKFKCTKSYNEFKKEGFPQGILIIKQYKDGGTVSNYGDMSFMTIQNAISLAVNVTMKDLLNEKVNNPLFDNLNNDKID